MERGHARWAARPCATWSRAPSGLYYPGAVTGQTGNKGLRAVFFQSLTSAGAQRQGVPRATGTGNEDSVGSAVLDSSQGSVWLLWVAAAPPITAKLTRFPAD
ncbi:MAG: hypothetical protein IT380_26610 [Myxococcales bacterium]|nr:hypothetical protein [Myxococcales bacterium]